MQQQQDPQVNPNKLYIGNLPFSTGEEDLRQLCGQFGEVVDVKLITDFNGRSKGFAFVEFSNQDEANAAIEGLNEKEIDGRTIFVKVARPKTPRQDGDRGGYRRGGDRQGGFSRGPRNFDRPRRNDYNDNN